MKIFDTNLAGVMKNFSRGKYAHYVTQQKELQLKRYLKRLQVILDAQNNIIFKLHNNEIYIANKALYKTAGVRDLKEYKTKFPSALDFISDSNCHNSFFRVKDYEAWIEKIIQEYKGKCEVRLFDHLTQQMVVMQLHVTRVEEENNFVFTLENITAQQKQINVLKKLVYKDDLTGLDNLRGFEEMIAQKLAKLPNSNLKILMLSLKGFSQYSKYHTQQESEHIIQEVANVIQTEYPIDSARIGSSHFALLSDTLTLQNANQLLESIDTALHANVDAKEIQTNAALILLHDKDTSKSIIERGEILLNSIQNSPQKSITDDAAFQAEKQKHLEEQHVFLALMKTYYDKGKSLSVTNYYMEIPLQSTAKIIHLTHNEMTLSIRKIAAAALQINDKMYITMPKKPNFKAYVKYVDVKNSQVVLENFQSAQYSALDRRNIHVRIENPIEIVLQSQKAQIPEELHTVSLTTFVVYVQTLYDIHIDSELTMRVRFFESEENFLGTVDKIMPVDNKFKLIIHLKNTPSIKSTLTPFISKRQLKIIQQLQEKASYV
ncbi:GGDEF domain-containing protein [Sulfurimonas sp. ST-27]|uniref:GGDEF domain-containing protein n=1 Tax=Sulfurimonas sp. ST-27 TaxID=3400152 RepID=UPI003AB4A770